MNYATHFVKSTYKGVKSATNYITSYVISPNTKINNTNEINEINEINKVNTVNTVNTVNKVNKVNKVNEVNEIGIKYSWTSYILFFKTPYENYMVDQGHIFIGDVPHNYYAFFLNFSNWKSEKEKLYYIGDVYDPVKKTYVNKTEINPSDVYFHVKNGDTRENKKYFFNDPSYYLHYFPNPNSKVCKALRDELTPDKLSIHDTSSEFGQVSSVKERNQDIQDPKFQKSKCQIYGERMNHILYTGINHLLIK